MRLPKSITIGGIKYEIVRSKDGGGSFRLYDKKIIIGRDMNDETQFETLIHEVLELVLADLMLRYRKDYVTRENGHLLFVFNHDQFERVAANLGAALRSSGLLKEGLFK